MEWEFLKGTNTTGGAHLLNQFGGCLEGCVCVCVFLATVMSSYMSSFWKNDSGIAPRACHHFCRLFMFVYQAEKSLVNLLVWDKSTVTRSEKWSVTPVQVVAALILHAYWIYTQCGKPVAVNHPKLYIFFFRISLFGIVYKNPKNETICSPVGQKIVCLLTLNILFCMFTIPLYKIPQRSRSEKCAVIRLWRTSGCREALDTRWFQHRTIEWTITFYGVYVHVLIIYIYMCIQHKIDIVIYVQMILC